MPRLIWSPHALRKVQRLYRFLAERYTGAAGRALRAIREGVLVIAQRPGIGRPVEDMEPELREWLFSFQYPWAARQGACKSTQRAAPREGICALASAAVPPHSME